MTTWDLDASYKCCMLCSRAWSSCWRGSFAGHGMQHTSSYLYSNSSLEDNPLRWNISVVGFNIQGEIGYKSGKLSVDTEISDWIIQLLYNQETGLVLKTHSGTVTYLHCAQFQPMLCKWTYWCTHDASHLLFKTNKLPYMEMRRNYKMWGQWEMGLKCGRPVKTKIARVGFCYFFLKSPILEKPYRKCK